MSGALDLPGEEWPSEDGWPYPDDEAETDVEPVAFDSEADDDLVSIHALASHLFDGLDPLEQRVLTERFGLGGAPPQSMKELQRTLGLPRADLRVALGDGIAKVRAHLI